MYCNFRKNIGITIVVIVITIIILIGIAIGTLGGEKGLLAKVNQDKKTQIKEEIKEEIKEKLTYEISELQTEKEGKATLDDITQEWADKVLQDYEVVVTTDTSISGKKIKMTKSNITVNYIIDEKLSIAEIENEGSIELSYQVKERIENKVKTLINISEKENGIAQIEFLDRVIECNGKKEVGIDYEVELEKEYKIKITSKNGDTKEETILISDYWYNITKNLGEGVEIDNIAIKAAYNKPYEATLTAQKKYEIIGLTVTMGGQTVTTAGNNIVDMATGKIYIEKVTGDIQIIATSYIPIVGYWKLKDSLKNEIEGGVELETYKGTPVFKDNSLYLNNTVMQTSENCLISQKYTMIFEMGKIEYTTNIAGCMPIIGTGYTDRFVGGVFSGLMYTNSKKLMLTNGRGDNFSVVENNSLYDNTKFNRIVIRYDGTNLECFINGTSAMKTTGVSNKNNPLYIGGSPTRDRRLFNESATKAYFKNLLIYNIALSDSEIANFQF